MPETPQARHTGRLDADALNTLVALGAEFNRGGFGALRPFLHPDFEFHEPPEQPGATVFRGREAALAGMARWAESWAGQQSLPEGIAELPDGRIVVLTREIMQGRDGIRVEQSAVQVFTVRESVVLRWDSYWNRERTLTELGLRPADFATRSIADEAAPPEAS